MSLVVVLPKGRKDHIAIQNSDGDIITMCGKHVPDGSILIKSAPRVDLCKKCAEWLGRTMVSDYLGLIFDGPYKKSIIGNRKRT